MRGWEPVTTGRSGALVHRSPDGRTYAKTASTPGTVAELEAERDRLGWLGTTPVGAPRVLDWFGTGSTRSLVTSALRVVPASALAAARSPRAVQGLVGFLTLLHSLPTGECPSTGG